MTSRLPRVALYAFCNLLIVFLVAPLVIVVVMSFSSLPTLHFPPPALSLQWYEAFFGDGPWVSATLTSVAVAFATALLAVVLGTPGAIALARTEFVGKRLVNSLVLAPVITPVVVVAIGMYGIFVDLRLVGSPIALVIAHTVLAVPLVIVAVQAALLSSDPNLELAAHSLGAGPLATFRYVTLPLIAPGIAAGVVFAFVISWDEVVTSIFLTTPTFVTLPVIMWGQIHYNVDPTMAAASAIVIGVSIGLLLMIWAVRSLAARRLGGAQR